MASPTNPPMTAAPASTAPSSTLDSALSTKWATALLARFALIWPKGWADSVAGVNHGLLVAEWAQGIAGLTGTEIRDGINYVRAHATWPPTIAEFRTACRGGATAEQRAYAARAQDETPALPRGTWGDTAQQVSAHVKAARATIQPRAARSLRNIDAGRWTREMESNFLDHANRLSLKVRAIEWPEGHRSRSEAP